LQNKPLNNKLQATKNEQQPQENFSKSNSWEQILKVWNYNYSFIEQGAGIPKIEMQCW